MQLINTYKHLEKRELLDCRIKSIKEIVRHYGLNLSSHVVLLLSEAYTFNYNRIKIPETLLEEIPYVTVSHNDLEKTFFRNLNIGYQKENIPGNIEGWEYIKSIINRDIPILFRIDSRFLKIEEGSFPKKEKLNLYYLSTLLLVGYDEEKGCALVVLTNDDEKENVSEIAIEDFQKYRSSFCVPFAPDGLCFYLKDDNILSEISSEDIKNATINSLIKITDTMLNEGETYDVDMGTFIGAEVRKGIFGMRLLRIDMQTMIDQYEKESNPKLIQLIMIFIRNNMLFGSYSAFREEFGQCLKICSQKHEIGALYSIGCDFEKISFKWKNFFTLLSGIAHNKGDMLQKLREAVEVWDIIIEDEQKLFSKIRDILT